jgi:glycosyltransferase involved in cell wall biosynthesis
MLGLKQHRDLTSPAVSVVVPAFNSELFVGPAIESILQQTLTDFELIIIDDGSTDDTLGVINSYKDPRIRVLRNAQNLGLATTRNIGIDAASGRYIAWLDSDDLSHPSRLKRQVSFLDSRSNLALCGTWGRTIGLENNVPMRYPRKPASIRSRMVFDNPFLTSSVMVRSSVLKGLSERFREDYAPAEDYDVWERIPREFGLANLPQYLTFHRQHAGQVSIRQSDIQRSAVRQVQRRQLERIGIKPTMEEIVLHEIIGVNWCVGISKLETRSALDWLIKLSSANAESQYFPVRVFKSVAKQRTLLVKETAAPSAIKRVIRKVRATGY